MKHLTKYILCLYLAAFGVLASEPSGFTREQLEWLESDTDHPALSVNEGELEFLDYPADKPEHHHRNHIYITPDSIQTGWTRLEQCHDNLDAVPSLQIVYHRDRVRDLSIVQQHNIERAWVDGHTVQLENIRRNSRICIEANSMTLHRESRTHMTLKNGPFMRQFLDGFYPLRVSLHVHFPGNLLRLVDVLPVNQDGWDVQSHRNKVILGGRFTGKLTTRLRFEILQ